MLVPKPRPERIDPPITLSRVLLTEGDTPQHFFEALAKDLGIAQQIEIRNFGGLRELGKYLKTFVTLASFKTKVASLGIVRDAEDDPATAKQSVETLVRQANVPQNVRVSIAILPDDLSAGMIETLCLRSVDTSPVFECIDGMVTCLDTKQMPLPAVRDKHILDFYLAATNKPQTFPGIAASQGAWPFTHTCFDSLKQFLQQL
jgi:hypothetical protein